MYARVKADGPGWPITMAGAHFVKFEARPVPEGAEDEAEANPYLEVVDEPSVEAAPVSDEATDTEKDTSTEADDAGADIDATDDAAPSATDAARELALAHGIDLASVEGTGDEGRIVKGDVEALVDA